jgi:hypothetical protein
VTVTRLGAALALAERYGIPLPSPLVIDGEGTVSNDGGYRFTVVVKPAEIDWGGWDVWIEELDAIGVWNQDLEPGLHWAADRIAEQIRTAVTA